MVSALVDPSVKVRDGARKEPNFGAIFATDIPSAPRLRRQASQHRKCHLQLEALSEGSWLASEPGYIRYIISIYHRPPVPMREERLALSAARQNTAVRETSGDQGCMYEYHVMSPRWSLSFLFRQEKLSSVCGPQPIVCNRNKSTFRKTTITCCSSRDKRIAATVVVL